MKSVPPGFASTVTMQVAAPDNCPPRIAVWSVFSAPRPRLAYVGDLAGELAAFICRVLRCVGRPEIRFDQVAGETDGEHDVESPFAWSDEGDGSAEEAESGPTIGDYFDGLFSWKPGGKS